MSFCPNCGQEVEENAKFCDHCGSSLNEDLSIETQDQKQPPKKKKSKKKWYWFIILVILLLLIGLYFWTQPKSSSSSQSEESISSSSYSEEVQSSSSSLEESNEEKPLKPKKPKKEEVTGDQISADEKNILAASILYVKANPPAPNWNNNDFVTKSRGTRQETPDYFNEGGVYAYTFENKEVLGSGGGPMFVPANDFKKMYFYTSGGIPVMTEDGDSYMEPRNPEDKVSADELATYINSNGLVKEYQDLASRLNIQNIG